ncbi:CopG family transcriptional regulator [Pusillimonas sp. NJUB218]|uniref:CopG family transcriptional regulator n=3 Tax=Pusillimonas TaxID=305976 RepID=A0A842HVB5_9BURK|nr:MULTISPECIES: DUF411 domain-containing protein [Pusillimonas]MBC2771121.1 CopG family transcriptional regulator [Pusillimonas minor]ROT46865.1 CopG family transcriptional regulator [Pusillimonas sp. NJUB218]
MKSILMLLAGAMAAGSVAAAQAATHLTVYQDPNCGCCTGWAKYMESAGFTFTSIKTSDVAQHKTRLGVPPQLSSCHTAIVSASGQIVEGHVPANVVHKLLAQSATKGVAAPGMPANAPGMGDLDGNLVTVDFQGRPFSRD